MHQKQAIAIGIALQTHVLQTCSIHHEIFCDDDVDPSSAFALALELVRQQTPYVREFEQDAHALTDLLSETIASAPTACPRCAAGGGREHRSRAGIASVMPERLELHLA